MWWCKRFAICILALQLIGCSALFEDQVGKFDWRVQHLGCPSEIRLETSKFGQDQLLVSTSRNVIGSVDINSGEIVWRQLNEELSDGLVAPKLLLNNNDLFSIVNGGEYLRVFDRETGVLKWQTRLNAHGLEKHDIVLKNKYKFVRVQNNVLAFDKTAKPIWQAKLASDIEWQGVVASENHVIAVGKTKSGGLRIRFFAYTDGKESKLQADDAANEKFIVKDCVFSGSSLVCLNGKTLNTAYFTDEGFTRLSLVEVEGADKFFDLRALNRPGLFTVRMGEKLSLLRVDSKASTIVLTTNYGTVQADSSTAFSVYSESTKKLQIFDQNTRKEVATIEIPSDNFAPVKQIALLEAENGQLFEIVVVRHDCRVDFYEARRSEKVATLEWSRFEGLATISSVEMIDLPLSDSQATIETEFSVPDATILKSFLLRVSGQVEQLRRSFISLANQFAKAFRLLTSGNESFPNVLRVLLGEDARPSKRPRSGASLEESKLELPMERDFFNLHKLIIVSTQSGSLHGIHNQYGTVLWSLYLGTQFEPMTTQLGKSKIPLFIQRTTANFQFDSQAAVAFNLKGTKKTRIVFFNPVNGRIVNSQTFDSVKRVEMAPFVNKETLSPLLVVDSNDKVHFLPALDSDFRSTQSLHLFSIDINSGVLKGDLVESRKGSLTTAWTTKLNLEADEKIVSVTGRNRNERVHSQGKVLGDRSVLYKYANPNLVAVMSVDSTHTVLTINLVDAANGAIVYTAKHERASEPVNLLHCENWVVYSYWNEKARRTELGVIELYEGLDQTNAKNFNSFTTVRHPLNVIVNSFVFPQGISAIAASETEQGLTTRSIVVAMPFGGLLEVSKRLLDARRPLEMTADLREEMIIPYMPEIPIATEDLINYNQTVHQIEGIKTAASGLESTSLMLAYGLDLFYTRLTPSGTFDVLKDDFDYILISVVLFGLVVASVVLKRISRYQTLKQAWA